MFYSIGIIKRNGQIPQEEEKMVSDPWYSRRGTGQSVNPNVSKPLMIIGAYRSAGG
jgi:hypothetical protein